MTAPLLGCDPRLDLAVALALRAHGGQWRKGQEGVPYVVHPLHVGVLLARHGQEVDVVAAGVLHDVVEDSEVTLPEIVARLGPRVGALVAEVSEEKAHSWERRKQHTIDAIRGMSDGARAITAADKLHNLADLGQLLAARGAEPVWKLFKRGRGPTLDYYRRVHAELARWFPHPLTDALGQALAAVDARG
ncbi:MAG: bifunctional (p)ppGpp synthetase/guanosine-3',5'-bis(diphosphate) 3'-pyrophosphohydrolase [Planctomycetes bacterium]|nr:bifunctional (p)ppGpp synthetase/guanosine-3',5'-bis(diphosphate) 3'-pyrophosphohydrolase [Planctomycetota bacterium]